MTLFSFFLIFRSMIDENTLDKGPIGKTLFSLALPTVVAGLINMLYNVVDRVYIGHMGENGSLALTGVGVCLPIIMFVSAFSSFVATGSAPRSSIFIGNGEKEKAERLLSVSLLAQCVISLLLTVLLLLFNKPLLLAFGASENTIGYASDYMSVYALGTIFVEVTLGLNAFITAQGRTVVSMLVVLTGAVLNIVLDPIFIYVFDLGVKGAAWATVLSQMVSAVLCVIYLSGKKSMIKLSFSLSKGSVKLFMPSFLLGLASFVMQSTESLISICFNSSLLKYGGDMAVGAMTICSSVMQMSMLPLQGIAQGAQPLTSYNYGKGNMERVKSCYKALLLSCFTYSFILWAAVELFPSFFASIFTSETALIEYTVPVIRIYVMMLGLMGILISSQMTFVSIGSALSSVSIALVRKIVLLIPLIFIMPHLFPANPVYAVFSSEPIADFLAITFAVIVFAIQFPKALKNKKIV